MTEYAVVVTGGLPIPRYTWSGLVKPMWDIIRIWTRKADVTMVTSKVGCRLVFFSHMFLCLFFLSLGDAD